MQRRLDICIKTCNNFNELTEKFIVDVVVQSIANAKPVENSVKALSSAIVSKRVSEATSKAVSSHGSAGGSTKSKASHDLIPDDDDPDQQVVVKIRNPLKLGESKGGNEDYDPYDNSDSKAVLALEEERKLAAEAENLTMAERMQKQVESMRAMRKADSAKHLTKGKSILGTLKDTAHEVVFYK